MLTRWSGGRFWVIAGAAGLAAGTSALVALALHRDTDEVRALRTPGMVVAITPPGAPLILGTDGQKALLRLFPGLRRRIGGVIVVPHSRDRAPIVWGSLGGQLLSGGPPMTQVRLSDDVGDTVDTVAFCNWTHPVGSTTLAEFPVATFPRRGRRIRVRAESGRPDLLPGIERWIVNTAGGSFPRWSPEELPAKRTIGKLEVTLESCRLTRQAGTNPSNAFGVLRLRLRENSAPAARNWKLHAISIDDPTGNRAGEQAVAIVKDDEHLEVPVVPSPLPREPSYRAHLEFVRQSHLPDYDRWSLLNLPVPQARAVTLVSRKASLHGCGMELLYLWGPDHVDERSVQTSEPIAVVRLTGNLSRLCLRRFQAGRWDDVDLPFYPSEAGDRYLTLAPKHLSRQADLKLALTPIESFDFYVPTTE